MSQDTRSLLALLESRAPSPNRVLSERLGRVGFGIPKLDNLRAYRATELPDLPNFKVSGGASPQDNWFFLPDGFSPRHSLHVKIPARAGGNVVIFGEASDVYGSILLGQESLAIFGSARSPASLKVNLIGRNNTFYWGRNSSSNGLSVFFAGEGNSILIGEDCMVSHEVSVMCSDMHAMVSRADFTQLNPPADVVIEPHVWLGRESMILKGTTIGFGAIIGARATVSRDVDRWTAVAGMPARAVRQDTTWLRSVTPRQQEIDELTALEAAFLACAPG